MPFHIGGDSTPAVLRAARLGNGWYGSPARNAEVREELKRCGREGEAFEYSSITIGMPTRAELDEMAKLGTERVVVTPWAPELRAGEVKRDGLGLIERYARELGMD